ncbi:MAG: AbrB/MazE/SpoVT family DNA-binding domain-containing protein [Oscillospiraceae bacterium]|jgi:transcriptional pleiotropic regulator of transition state genes|nr:AbrB/MazE/SpoVT family DNA-binding domain-containing protein [Oscillospiraceae bacterium]
MKATGIIRPIDQLGRIVIPSELRKAMNLKQDDRLEIFVSDNSIILRKLEYSCTFCGERESLVEYCEQMICSKCLETLKKL